MIKNKQDLLSYIAATSKDPNHSEEKQKRQKIFLQSIIRRYKFYFLSGYTMKFISLIKTNADSRKSLPIISYEFCSEEQVRGENQREGDSASEVADSYVFLAVQGKRPQGEVQVCHRQESADAW
jgi:hypothetical protein